MSTLLSGSEKIESTTPSSSNKSTQESIDDLKDFLKGDDNEPEVKEEEEAPKKVKEKSDDEDDIELRDDEGTEDEEKLELDEKDKGEDEIKIEDHPRKKQVLSKYPNFFKDFPAFEKMMFRDKTYTELFGSIDDARDVAEKATLLNKFEQDLIGGDTTTILSSIKKNDAKAFDKIVDNYLPALYSVDKDAYIEVVTNVTKTMLRQVSAAAEKTRDVNVKKRLEDAVSTLNQVFFQQDDTPSTSRRTNEDNDETKKIEQQRAEFTRERYETVRDDIQGKVDNVLRATISEHIDPQNQMSPYTKRNAIKDALNEVHVILSRDSNFRRHLDRLWNDAYEKNFNGDSANSIRRAYLGRSKQTLVGVIRKIRSEALKDSTPSSKVDENDDDKQERTKRSPIPTGRPHQRSGKLQMKPGESIRDFLSRDD